MILLYKIQNKFSKVIYFSPSFYDKIPRNGEIARLPKIIKAVYQKITAFIVGVPGFEPGTPCSQSR